MDDQEAASQVISTRAFSEAVDVPDLQNEDVSLKEQSTAIRRLAEARRTDLQAVEDLWSRVESHVEENAEDLSRRLVEEMIEVLSWEYEHQARKAAENGDWDRFEGSVLFDSPEDLREAVDTEPYGSLLPSRSPEDWAESPPEKILEIADSYLSGKADEKDQVLSEWAYHVAFAVTHHVSHDVDQELRREGKAPSEIPDEEWEASLEAYLEDFDLEGHVEGLLARGASRLVDVLKWTGDEGELTPLQIEHLLGLYDEETAPTPRPETTEYDPSPFQGDPPMAVLLADTFSTTTIEVLREADGDPAPTDEEEWGEDGTGHPIRVEQLGNPYEGQATFKVQAFGEPDPTTVEASMGWKMLDWMDMDTVWLHLLLLGYASATHRRGDRPVIRIPRRTVERVFGFRNRNVRKERRAEKIKRHVEALQSIFVQFQNVHRHGNKLHFRGDMTSGAPLWGLRMVAKGQQDLFTGETVADWHLEAREGMWAEEFLHNYGDQWTPLPKEWFKQIDRRGSRNFAQRLAVYLLFQFRINAKYENRVRKSAKTLLEVCGIDMNQRRSSKQRSVLKRRLLKTLDALEEDYGIEVHASQVHMDKTKEMSFDRWKGRAVVFDPPCSMDGRLFQNAEGETPPLPDVAGDWKPNQIRHLRTEILEETQAELGDRLSVSKQYVSQLERGTSEPSTRVRKILDRLQARHE